MIEFRNLTKQYGDRTAIDGVSVRLNNGKIYAILGGRGAGKSTLLGLLAGVLRPTEGRVRINGFDMAREAKKAKRGVAYLPFGAPLCGGLTVEEHLRFLAEARGVSFERSVRQIHDALEVTDTLSLRDTPTVRLSAAGRVRVGIAGMLIGGAETLVLDEPTALLPKSEREGVLALLGHLAINKTVFVATEDWEVVEALQAELIFLEAGQIKRGASLSELSDEEIQEMKDALAASATATAVPSGEEHPEYDGEYEIIDTTKEGR